MALCLLGAMRLVRRVRVHWEGAHSDGQRGGMYAVCCSFLYFRLIDMSSSHVQVSCDEALTATTNARACVPQSVAHFNIYVLTIGFFLYLQVSIDKTLTAKANMEVCTPPSVAHFCIYVLFIGLITHSQVSFGEVSLHNHRFLLTGTEGVGERGGMCPAICCSFLYLCLIYRSDCTCKIFLLRDQHAVHAAVGTLGNNDFEYMQLSRICLSIRVQISVSLVYTSLYRFTRFLLDDQRHLTSTQQLASLKTRNLSYPCFLVRIFTHMRIYISLSWHYQRTPTVHAAVCAVENDDKVGS